MVFGLAGAWPGVPSLLGGEAWSRWCSVHTSGHAVGIRHQRQGQPLGGKVSKAGAVDDVDAAGAGEAAAGVDGQRFATRRKRQRSATDASDTLALIPEPLWTESADRNELTQALASLSDNHREILLMRFVDDMTQPEIATALNVPLGTVKSRLHHAVQAVKQSPETLDRLEGMNEV